MRPSINKKHLLVATFVSASTLLILIAYAKLGLSSSVTDLIESTAASGGDPQKVVQFRQDFDEKLLLDLVFIALGVLGVSSGCLYLSARDIKQDAPELDLPESSLSTKRDSRERDQMQWMADTSHELRTPISILRAQVEAFQDGVQEVNPKTLQILHSEIMGLSKLVDDLHWLANFDVGNLKHSFVPLDVASTLHDVAELFDERFAEKDLTIDKSGISKETCTAYADHNRVRQVFINLLENSLRYTNAGGKLKLSVSKNQSSIYIGFEDSQPGIPDEMLPKIFDRFFRVEPSRSRAMGGSGLGLSICKTLIDAHSGTISATKSDLGGIKIEIVLPTARSLRGG